MQRPDTEIFPKQDRLSEGQGSMIRMPFGGHRRNDPREGCLTQGETLLMLTIQE